MPEASVPLACNINAISPAERPRYKELATRLRASLRDRAELTDGFRFRLDVTAISLPEAAEWITLESLCCPFLEFQLEVSSQDFINKGEFYLALTGPEGAKAILREEFPFAG